MTGAPGAEAHFLTLHVTDIDTPAAAASFAANAERFLSCKG